MAFTDLIKPFPWAEYSKKVLLRITTPYCIGAFSLQDAESRDLHLAVGSEGTLQLGNRIDVYWLVDKTDGVIIDARFQAFGNTALIAAGEIGCELVIGKNYDQARRITADLIDTHARDKNDRSAFPQETYPHLNLAVDAIEKASISCQHIPLSQNYSAPPVTGHAIEVLEGGYPGFQTLTIKQQLAVVEEVLTKEVRPYIELDAGGVQVLNIIEGKEVIIVYQGACTSCHSSTGATLSYIQQILRAKVDPEIIVTPEL